MIKKIGILVAATIWSASANAQDAGQGTTAPPDTKPQPVSGSPAGNTSTAAAPKFWLQIGVAPEITSEANQPRSTDSTKIT